MNINLLPRKPRIQKIFWPIMLSVIIIYAVVAIIIFYAEFNNGSSIEDKNAEIVKLQTEINSLVAMRQPDPLAEDFKDFQSDINALKEFRRDWIEILQQISTSLPLTSRILSFEVNELGELMMNTQFAQLQQVAEYIAVLSESNLIESVNATNIARIELPITTNSSSDTTSGSLEEISGLIDQTDNSTQIIDPEDFTAELEEGITPPKDESERILNELRWLIEQKAAKEEHGILIPTVEMPDVPDIDNWMDSGLFTPEEIDSALEEVNEYKDLNTTPTETTLVEKKIYIYQTTLTIKMAALDMAKEVSP